MLLNSRLLVFPFIKDSAWIFEERDVGGSTMRRYLGRDTLTIEGHSEPCLKFRHEGLYHPETFSWVGRNGLLRYYQLLGSSLQRDSLGRPDTSVVTRTCQATSRSKDDIFDILDSLKALSLQPAR